MKLKQAIFSLLIYVNLSVPALSQESSENFFPSVSTSTSVYQLGGFYRSEANRRYGLFHISDRSTPIIADFTGTLSNVVH